MKQLSMLLGAIALFVAFGFTAPKPVTYKIDTQQSKVNWVGRKITGEHNGGINLAEGHLISTGKTISGGAFTIDMNSMTCADIENPGSNGKLVNHLKSEDFFGTEKYPTAQLVITKVTPTGKDTYALTGNLTIKGITKEVQFPATIKTTGNQLNASAKIVVNRTHYDIKYRSGSFFDSLGDKAIHDDFDLNVELVANK